MAKVNSFCYSCDVDFKVTYSDEDNALVVEHCPFCGELIDSDDADMEDERTFDVDSEEFDE